MTVLLITLTIGDRRCGNDPGNTAHRQHGHFFIGQSGDLDRTDLWSDSCIKKEKLSVLETTISYIISHR